MAELDHETQAFGLATAGGIVSSTGVAGITLGGGLGFLSRTHGLVHDNLRSVDVVTAEGELAHASEDENADLFWGMRGGGGNFGIATSFEFDLHELGPEILNVRALHPLEAAPAALRFYADFMADASDQVQVYAAFLMGSPQYGLPEALHGKTLLAMRGMFAGDLSEGREAFQPLLEYGSPIAASAQPVPYTAHQKQVDELYRKGHRNYWKSDFYDRLSDDLIAAVMAHVDPLPTPYSTPFIEWMGGAVAEAPPDATAFPHRDAAFSLTVAPKWEDSGRDEEMIGWAQSFHAAVEPYSMEGVYVNYMDQDEGDRVADAYGDRMERLVALKNEWDPDNVFRMNQNIEPTVPVS